MSRQSMITEILSKFDELGIPHHEGMGTDISIDADFLDAAFSTGTKNIKYEASIFFDETESTVFMWEMTKETGSGISFGSSSESSFQTGSTLHRKVKSIQYGPEGKVYEYNLDLGAIPKIVKDAAKAEGWRFKTVLRKDRAMFPRASAPTFQDIIELPETKEKNKPVFYIPLIILAIITFVLLAFNNTSVLGWILSVAVFVALFLIRGRIMLTGCLWQIIIWIGSAILLFAVFIMT